MRAWPLIDTIAGGAFISAGGFAELSLARARVAHGPLIVRSPRIKNNEFARARVGARLNDFGELLLRDIVSWRARVEMRATELASQHAAKISLGRYLSALLAVADAIGQLRPLS